MIAEFVIFAVVGIVTGTMAGLFGVGGGLIIVPVMHFIMTSNGLEESLAMPLSIGTALPALSLLLHQQRIHTIKKALFLSKGFLSLQLGC